MRFASIASGSSGNCIYIGSGDTNILIDAGISKKRIEAGLNGIGLSLTDIDGILVTHEHSDHIQGLGVVSRAHHIPIYGTRLTLEAVRSVKSLGKIESELYNDIEADMQFNIKDLKINPFSISHDAADPVAYRVEDSSKCVAVATDMGKYDDYTVGNLTGLDSILIEANHDIRMLEAGPYPYPLKRRILGDRGHLSNESSGRLLKRILNDKMKHIFLGHLSKENNYDKLAFETVRLEINTSDNVYKADDFNIQVAKRDESSRLYEV